VVTQSYLLRWFAMHAKPVSHKRVTVKPCA
jgi:hypothetical protein